jgi:predicted esterase
MPYQEIQNKQICVGSNGFAEALPSTYDGVKMFPLLVFLHGLGEQGNGNTELFAVSKHGPLAQVKFNGYDTPFVMIAPQFRKGYWPAAANVQEVINYAKANYKVDGVFLTGLSMGGGATMDYAQSNPKGLLAALPTCPALGSNQTGAKNIADAKLPVYFTHNNGDPQVSYSNSTGWVNAINTAGGNAKLLTFASTTHDSWTRTYDLTRKELDGKNWAEWLLQFYNQIEIPPITPTKFSILPTDETYLKVTKGWAQTATDIYGGAKVISGTTDQKLYNAERWGIFDYSVPVPNGEYTVVLKFCELFHSSIGRRVFNVDLNGNRVLTAFDILAQVPKFTALEYSFPVNVTNGKIDIDFDPTVDNAKITAIDIIPGKVVTYPVKIEVVNEKGEVIDTISKTYNEPVTVKVS